jgi:hypothetical protein
MLSVILPESSVGMAVAALVTVQAGRTTHSCFSSMILVADEYPERVV